jgi:preprotein translocase subunit SecG
MKLLRRWRYVVDWRSQIGTAMQIVAVLAGICLVCSVAVKYVKSDEALELMSGEGVRNFLYRVTAAQFIVSAVTLGVLAVYLTHRFAGPAIALERAIRALVHGQTDRKLHLRERDYLKAVGAAVEDLRMREETRAKKLLDLDRCIGEGDTEAAKEILKGLISQPLPAPAAAAVKESEPVPAAQC